MNTYSYSAWERAKASVWRALNNGVDRIRKPIRSPQIFLVTGNAAEEKVAEVEARLRFLFSHLGDVPKFRRAQKASPLAYLRYRGVAAVDEAAIPAFLCRHTGWIANLDYDKNYSDGWALMDLGTALSRKDLDNRISRGREIFVDRVKQIKAVGPRPVYLFGTGPSLILASQRSFSDGITVVCNTIVRDANIWHELKPAFFAAGDAIYHFGDNLHARTFRADALRRLQESEGRTLFVYPARYDVIIRSEFCDIEELLVPIPMGEHTDVTNNLISRFALPNVPNVLNNLLLPLGCTLSADIRLCGFDGRAPNDTGFWSYSSAHAYPELIPTIRNAHPAFFDALLPKGDESRYVRQTHGDWLDSRLSDAESRGFKFRMLHPSWTPTLNARYIQDGITREMPA
ncbi:MAG: hypothetical protein KDB71_02240 [Mycobacterium sp.]|nr:hypothetical protein [Mycobacterium sp.]